MASALRRATPWSSPPSASHRMVRSFTPWSPSSACSSSMRSGSASSFAAVRPTPALRLMKPCLTCSLVPMNATVCSSGRYDGIPGFQAPNTYQLRCDTWKASTYACGEPRVIAPQPVGCGAGRVGSLLAGRVVVYLDRATGETASVSYSGKRDVIY